MASSNSDFLNETVTGPDGHGFSMKIRGLEIDTRTSTNPYDGRLKIGPFIANSSGVFVSSASFGNVSVNAIYANGSYGTTNQVLRTNGVTNFWGPAPSGGGGGGQTNVFSAIAVSGQSTLYADGPSDTMTMVAGFGIAITTTNSTDTVTYRVTNALASNAYLQLFIANTNSFVKSQLANTNLAIQRLNINLLATNNNIRTLVSDRMQVANTNLLVASKLSVANAAAIYQTKAIERAALANTNIRVNAVWTALTGTNTAIRAIITVDKSNLQSTNTALRLLINDRLQVANAAAIYQTKAIERAALANTNAFIKSQLANTNLRVNSVWTGLTGTNTAIRAIITVDKSNLQSTNTALRLLIADRLQVANAAAVYQTKAIERAALANTNSFIKSQLANTNIRVNAVWTGLTGTNTAIRSIITVDKNNLQSTNTALRLLIADRLQVANAAAIYQTKAIERAALANTNIRIDSVWTGLTTSNTALRLLIADRIQVANAAAIYATKASPATSGLWAHTGHATISTNLVVSGNTSLVGLFANGSLGTANYVLKTNGSTVFWGFASGGGGGPVDWANPGAIGSSTPNSGVFTFLTTTANAHFSNNSVTGAKMKGYREHVESMGTIAGGTVTFDLDVSNFFDLTLGSASTAVTISNPPPSGTVYTFTVIVRQDGAGSRVMTWPGSVVWPNGVLPPLTTTGSKTDILQFMTVDGGTTYWGGFSLGNL